MRVALQALAAVLGGAQSLHCNGRDEALALPTEDSATIALRTQQILLHESGVANTVDPVAGAYAVEALTDRIERDATEWLARIDAIGGALVAVETGDIQRHIQDAAYRAQQTIDAGEAVVVGVNRFVARDSGLGTRDEGGEQSPKPKAQSPKPKAFGVDPDVERQQIERVRAVRAGRSPQEWRDALARVEQAARDGSNLVPPIIAAVDVRATLGEIADALRRVFGEYTAI
ncbi:MAG: Methylmalonyl-CoA mutase [Acidobacteria bacterium]|nr:Methylmalonyl-CoA mutase [Acidobacteriota bacterium]